MEGFGFERADLVFGHRGGEIWIEDGEGFVGAVLARAEALYHLWTGGVAAEQVAADALDGYDFSFEQGIAHFMDHSVLAVEYRERHTGWPFAAIHHAGEPGFQSLRGVPVHRDGTVGTAVGLAVMSSVTDIRIFRTAFCAHVQPGHGGIGAVVGQGRGDGIAWPAMQAGSERIAGPSAVRIRKFGATIIAEGDIGGEEEIGFRGRIAIDDIEGGR